MKLVLHSRSLLSSAINYLEGWPPAETLCCPGRGLYLGFQAVGIQAWPGEVRTGAALTSGQPARFRPRMGLLGTQALLGSRTSFQIDTFRAAPEARGLSGVIIEGYRGAKPADEPATTAVGFAKGAGGSATTAGDRAKDGVGVATSAVSFATSAVGLAEASVEAAEGGGELSMSGGEVADAAGEFATSAVGPAKAHPTIFLECADLSAL